MGKGGHGGGSNNLEDSNTDPKEYYGWLAFCTVGMVSSLTMYGIALEYATSGDRKLHEISFVFVTTSIYSMTAYICREIFQEKPTAISKYQMLTLSCTSILSTVTSVRSLRYVIYPVQVLFKSCKPVPVMVFGAVLGKKYPLKKYVNVAIITIGVMLFMGGGSSTSKKGMGSAESTTLMGGLLLTLSLCFDGATGAYEDKLMAVNNVEPFDLMFNIQFGKAMIAFITLVVTNGLPDFFRTLSEGGFTLMLLGVTGAMGQVFVFVTISKFGALNCALIGLVRKILSLILSFLLYGHTMNGFQTMGIMLALASMIANFYDKGGGKKGPAVEDVKTARAGEKTHLLSEGAHDESDDDEEKGANGSSGGGGGGRGNKASSSLTIKDPFADIALSPITQAEVVISGAASPNSGSSQTPDVGSDSDGFDVLVEVDRVTPVKDESVTVEVDRVTPVGSKGKGKGKKGRGGGRT
jgi:UDP-galactose transporter B1